MSNAREMRSACGERRTKRQTCQTAAKNAVARREVGKVSEGNSEFGGLHAETESRADRPLDASESLFEIDPFERR
jgi:hypothetical protein